MGARPDPIAQVERERSAATAGLVVTGYEDAPVGTMLQEAVGSGRFSEIVLRPTVTIAPGADGAADAARADELHERVGDHCFTARSVNFPVRHEPSLVVAEGATAERSVSGR